MSLKYIIQEWAKETGQPISTTAQHANAVEKINKAAREVWDLSDLPGCLREQVFDIDNTLKQITLPYYVDQIRGIRHYSSFNRVKLNDMRPRYSIGNWTQPLYSFRNKQIVAIGHSLTNEAPLSIQLSGANSDNFTVNIKMSTSESASVVESVSIPAGTTSATTIKAPTSFPGIVNIEKDKLTDVDLTITDASGVVIAEIPNNEKASRYTLIQVVDNNVVTPVETCLCYELLYKIKLSPFFNYYDNYPVDGYDDIILWKALSNFWKRKPGATEQVTVAETTLATLIAQRAANAEAGEELEMNFGYNRFADVIGGGYPTGWPNRFPFRVL